MKSRKRKIVGVEVLTRWLTLQGVAYAPCKACQSVRDGIYADAEVYLEKNRWAKFDCELVLALEQIQDKKLVFRRRD